MRYNYWKYVTLAAPPYIAISIVEWNYRIVGAAGWWIGGIICLAFILGSWAR